MIDPGSRGRGAAALGLHSEDVASMAIQGSAALASVAGLVVLVMRAWPHRGALPLLGVVVYGATLIAAFLASALYHGMWHAHGKRIFRAIDHCTIFLLIAGTYTPISLLALRGRGGWFLLATIWALALAGAVLRLSNGPRFQRIAIPLYLAMGWLVLMWAVPLYETTDAVPLALFAAGGVFYTAGLLFYRAERLRFGNPLWHLCVVAGSVSFYVAIAFYLLPAAA